MHRSVKKQATQKHPPMAELRYLPSEKFLYSEVTDALTKGSMEIAS